jgi:hypothetical protein
MRPSAGASSSASPDPDDPEDTLEKCRARIFIPAKLEDNPHVDRRSYEVNLEALDRVNRARLRDGDWYADDGTKFFKASDLDAVEDLGRELDYLAERGELQPPAGELLAIGLDHGEHTAYVIGYPLERGGMYVVTGEELIGLEPSAAANIALDAVATVPAWEGLGVVRNPLELVEEVRYDAAGIQSQRTFNAQARRRVPGFKAKAIAFGSYKRETAGYLKWLIERTGEGRDVGVLAISERAGKLLRDLRGLNKNPKDGELWLKAGEKDAATGLVGGDDHLPDALVALMAPIARTQPRPPLAFAAGIATSTQEGRPWKRRQTRHPTPAAAEPDPAATAAGPELAVGQAPAARAPAYIEARRRRIVRAGAYLPRAWRSTPSTSSSTRIVQGGEWPPKSEAAAWRYAMTYRAFRESDREALKTIADWQHKDREYKVDPLPERIADAWADHLFGDELEITPATDNDAELLDELVGADGAERRHRGRARRRGRPRRPRGRGLVSRLRRPRRRRRPAPRVAQPRQRRAALHRQALMAARSSASSRAAAAAAASSQRLSAPRDSRRRRRRTRPLQGHRAPHRRDRPARLSPELDELAAALGDGREGGAIWPHGLPMLMGRIVNKRGRNPRLGVSEYAGIKDFLLDLNEAVTIGAENVRLTAKKRVVLPPNSASSAGRRRPTATSTTARAS